jgi:hypothetical protein
MDDTGAMRAIAQLALAAETGGDVEEAVQAALMAEVEPYEVAELSGVPSQASGEEAVPEPDRAFEPARRVCELLPSA